MSTIGDAIRARRLDMSLTQVELADLTKIPQGTISRIERGDYKEIPPPELLNPISVALKMSPFVFLLAAGYELPEVIDHQSDPVRAALTAMLDRMPLTPFNVHLLESALEFALRPESPRLVNEAQGAFDNGVLS